MMARMQMKSSQSRTTSADRFLQDEAVSKGRRIGFTIVEMIGTCLLLGAMFSMTVPMLLVVARERQMAEQRQFALQHATNLLEHMVARPWAELPIGESNIPEADADLVAVLPGLERTVFVKEFAASPESRQITASIRWRDSSRQLIQPIRVSAWVFAPKEAI